MKRHNLGELLNSYRIWEGKSPYDGAPIFALASCVKTPSANRKTGVMIQIYILRQDMSPLEAWKKGLDTAICGDCSLRDGTCYVTLVWLTAMWKLGKDAPFKSPEDISDISVQKKWPIRLGAYGDPAFIPIEVLISLHINPKTMKAKGGTGYTHQWKSVDHAYSEFLMASVDSLEEYLQAKAMQWRTFWVIKDFKEIQSSKVKQDVVQCAYYTKNVQCNSCGLCSGWRSKAKDIYTLIQ